jgi:hypothetical protein
MGAAVLLADINYGKQGWSGRLGGGLGWRAGDGHWDALRSSCLALSARLRKPSAGRERFGVGFHVVGAELSSSLSSPQRRLCFFASFPVASSFSVFFFETASRLATDKRELPALSSLLID